MALTYYLKNGVNIDLEEKKTKSTAHGAKSG